MSEDRKHLHYLDELSDWKIASDYPDVRGWEVKDSANKTVGKVDNLLVSKEKERVIYLDVEVDKSILADNHEPYLKSSSDIHEFINEDGEDHLILPIGMVNLNEDEEFVYADKIDYRTFSETKRKRKDVAVKREYERNVLQSFDRKNEYDTDDEKEETFYEKRAFNNPKFHKKD